VSVTVGSGEVFASRDGRILLMGPCATTVKPAWPERLERSDTPLHASPVAGDEGDVPSDLVVHQKIHASQFTHQGDHLEDIHIAKVEMDSPLTRAVSSYWTAPSARLPSGAGRCAT